MIAAEEEAEVGAIAKSVYYKDPLRETGKVAVSRGGFLLREKYKAEHRFA